MYIRYWFWYLIFYMYVWFQGSDQDKACSGGSDEGQREPSGVLGRWHPLHPVWVSRTLILNILMSFSILHVEFEFNELTIEIGFLLSNFNFNVNVFLPRFVIMNRCCIFCQYQYKSKLYSKEIPGRYLLALLSEPLVIINWQVQVSLSKGSFHKNC